MKAIQEIRRYIGTHANSKSAEILASLPETLFREESLALSDLYALDWESFELAIELLRDWRIDRYYADRADLFDPRAELAFDRTADETRRRVVDDRPEHVAAECFDDAPCGRTAASASRGLPGSAPRGRSIRRRPA
jgi:hypothetical protein